MAKAVLLLLTSPEPGREEEFNAWYRDIHLPQMLELPGVVAGQRYELSAAQPVPTGTEAKHLALYHLEAADLGETMTVLQSRAGQMTWSDSIVMEGLGAPVAYLYEEV